MNILPIYTTNSYLLPCAMMHQSNDFSIDCHKLLFRHVISCPILWMSSLSIFNAHIRSDLLFFAMLHTVVFVL